MSMPARVGPGRTAAAEAAVAPMRRPMPAAKAARAASTRGTSVAAEEAARAAHAATKRDMRIAAEAGRAMGMIMGPTRILEMFSRTKAILNGAVLSLPRWLAVTLLCLTALAVFVRGDRDSGRTADRTPTISQARESFPEAATVTYNSLGKSFVVHDRHARALGRIVDSSGPSPPYIGYAGQISVWIALDMEDRIVAVRLGENRETRSYLAYLDRRGFLDRWRGLTAVEAVEQQVAAVSGATLSSQAITKMLRHSLAIAYDCELPADMRSPQRSSLRCPVTLATYAVLLTAVVACFRPSLLGGYRRVVLIADVVILGVLSGTMLSLSQVHGLLAGAVDVRTQLPLLCLLGMALLAPLLWKTNLYCSWLCPFGAAQELVGLTDGPRRALPVKIARLLRIVRGGLLLSIAVALLAGVGLDLATVEPFAVFSARAASTWVLFLAGTCLLVSVFHPRLWCRCLCPTGRIVHLLMWGLLRSRRASARPVTPSRRCPAHERLSLQNAEAAGDT